MIGFSLKRLHVFPDNTHVALNKFVVYISLPALVLLQIYRLLHSPHNLGGSAFLPVLMPWLNFGFAAIAALTFGRLFNWDRKTLGGLMLTMGLCNTSFVGFPVLESLLGPHPLHTEILIDQLGSFLVFSTLGVLAVSTFSEKKSTPARVIKNILTFPSFVALMVAVVLSPFEMPIVLANSLEKLSSTLVPLALVSVGFQISLSRSEIFQFRKELSIGLFCKLLLFPFLMLLLYRQVIGLTGTELNVTVIEASMAPMITGAVLATEGGLNPPLVNLMVSIGIPLSLLTTPAWYWLLQQLA